MLNKTINVSHITRQHGAHGRSRASSANQRLVSQLAASLSIGLGKTSCNVNQFSTRVPAHWLGLSHIPYFST